MTIDCTYKRVLNVIKTHLKGDILYIKLTQKENCSSNRRTSNLYKARIRRWLFLSVGTNDW